MHTVLQEKNVPLIDAETVISPHFIGKHPEKQPYITHMLGIPGVGKSTVVRTLNTANAIVVAFDAVMEELSQYRQDKAQQGIEKAFEWWEEVAREIGYEILFRALEGGYNVIMDHSGARADHVEILRYAKQHIGYEIRIIALHADIETASRRAQNRQRHVPIQYFYERAKTLKELSVHYKAVADSYQEINTQ